MGPVVIPGGDLTLSLQYQATAYAAVYIELALSLDVPFITGERSTTPWVVKLGSKVRTLDSAD